MTPNSLHDLINSDPAAKALADAGNDAACADRCREIAPPEIVSTPLGELGVIAAAADPVAAETILKTIEAIAQQNPLVKRVLKWMQPGAPGVDFGDLRVRAMLTAAVEQGGLGLTAEQAGPLLRAAERPASVTAGNVSEAWARYRPDGVVVKGGA